MGRNGKNLVVILYSIIIFSLISFSTASVETMKPAKLNDEYLIVQTCASCTFINLTVTNNKGVIVQNAAMTNNGSGNWYYPITVTEIGRHDVTGVGDLDGTNTSFASYFEVTSDGFLQTTGFYILILALSLGFIILGIYGQDMIYVLFGSLGLYFIGLYILFNGIAGIKDAAYTWAIGLIVLGVAAYTSIRASHELISN